MDTKNILKKSPKKSPKNSSKNSSQIPPQNHVQKSDQKPNQLTQTRQLTQPSRSLQSIQTLQSLQQDRQSQGFSKPTRLRPIIPDSQIIPMKRRKLNRSASMKLPQLLQNTDTNIVVDHADSANNSIRYQLWETTDRYYEDYVYHLHHYTLSAVDEKGLCVIFCISIEGSDMKGCVISLLGTELVAFKKPRSITESDLCEILRSTFIKYNKFVFLKNQIKKPLIDFCTEKSFLPDKMTIGMIYAKHNQQTGQSMIKNTSGSDCYEKYLKLMNIPEIITELDTFHDIFSDSDETDNMHDLFSTTVKTASVGIIWRVSTMMSEEDVRQYIANVIPIIIFRDSPNAGDPYIQFDTHIVADLGIVNQIFIVVEKVIVNNKTRYRIGVFYRNMPCYEPVISEKFLFRERDIRRIILTKIYNGLINIRYNSKIAGFYLKPRLASLQELVDKYKV